MNLPFYFKGEALLISKARCVFVYTIKLIYTHTILLFYDVFDKIKSVPKTKFKKEKKLGTRFYKI